jgi:hypothetical protein
MSSSATDFLTVVLNTYPITASAGVNGAISPSGSIFVTQGTNQTFTITPNANYRILSVTVDGVNQGAIGSYTFTNLQAGHTISATFALNTGCANGTDASGSALTLISDATPTINRRASVNGKYWVTKFGTPYYCFGRNTGGAGDYLIPIGTKAEMDSFWSNIGTGRNLPGLYRIP